MTKEEKQILIKDLSARLPYGVVVQYPDIFNPSEIIIKRLGEIEHSLIGIDEYSTNINGEGIDIEYVKLYLRPISSMTKNEILELYKIAYNTWRTDSLYYKLDEWITFEESIQNNSLFFYSGIWVDDVSKVNDWLLEHHFDYRGLIEKGLAIEAPEGMYIK